MNRIIICTLLFLFPSVVLAETVVIRSGEHADFSRLVIQFESSPVWKFGRVDGGYELRSDAQGTDFDVSKVFNLIPKTRLSTVSSPGPGRLHIGVLCNCTGDAFEIRNGRLVLDIKDGAPDESSRFEAVMPSMKIGSMWPPISVIPNPHDNFLTSDILTSNISQTVPVPPKETPVNIGATTLPFVFKTEPSFPTQPDIDETGAFGVTMRGTADESLNTESVHDTVIAGSTSEIIRASENEFTPLIPTWPLKIATASPSEPVQNSQDRVELAKQALLLQFGRAATQGVFTIDLPNLANQLESVSKAPNSSNTVLPTLVDEGAESNPQNREHLRIQTVFDRDRKSGSQIPMLTDESHQCLGPELFELSDWGPENIVDAPFGDLRMNVVLEFDKPNPVAVQKLARRYLFLGFGAETKALLQAFDVDIPDADILLQIAELVDDGYATQPGRISSQLNCSTGAAMWGVLAIPRIQSHETINTKSVLRTFSGLPPHMRERLGPWLAEKFLAVNELQTATLIRDIAARATGELGARLQLMDARLSTVEKDFEGAIQQLEEVVMSAGDTSSDALVELIEARLALGLEIDRNTATLADALATEHKGTEMGRELSIAAIRALAGSGQIDEAFERIEYEILNGNIDPNEAEKLGTQAHLLNAQIKSDAEFLSTLFRNDQRLGKTSIEARAVHQDIASRLIKLELPAAAIRIYSDATFDIKDTDHQILAKAHLALGDHAGASEHLKGSDDDPSRLLMAQIKELEHDFPQAARVFAELEMDEEYESSVWRAGDWQAVVKGENATRAKVAELVLAAATNSLPNKLAAQNSELESFDGPLGSVADPTDPALDPISEGKELIEQSVRTRGIISDLFAD